MIKYNFTLLSLEPGSYLLNKGDFFSSGNPFESTKIYDPESDHNIKLLKEARANGFPEAKFVIVSVAYSVKDYNLEVNNIV